MNMLRYISGKFLLFIKFLLGEALWKPQKGSV